MRVLLDTVTYLWAYNSPELLSKKAIETLSQDTTIRELSAVSLSELAIKMAVGKLDWRKEEIVSSLSDLRVRVSLLHCDACLSVVRASTASSRSV